MSEPAETVELAASMEARPDENSASSEKQAKDAAESDALAVELPAPGGWTKKIIPKKAATPGRKEVVFVSPSGEEVKNRKQLERVLKAHPGSPSASEFDWATGETPRRSARISDRIKVAPAEKPESEPPKKKARKSGPKKGATESKFSVDDASRSDGPPPEQLETAATPEKNDSAPMELEAPAGEKPEVPLPEKEEITAVEEVTGEQPEAALPEKEEITAPAEPAGEQPEAPLPEKEEITAPAEPVGEKPEVLLPEKEEKANEEKPNGEKLEAAVEEPAVEKTEPPPAEKKEEAEPGEPVREVKEGGAVKNEEAQKQPAPPTVHC